MTSRSKSLIKYLIAIVLLAVILRSTDVSKIFGYLGRVSPLNLAAAFSLVTLAQIAAAARMRYFFRAGGYHLQFAFAVVLFYVGAFYNFLLPGGIGGDAYKVMLARKRLDMPTMNGIRLMVADRASGLCIIMMVMFAAMYGMDFSAITPYSRPFIIAAAVFTLVSYLALSHILLKQPPRVMLISLGYSFITQFLWIATLGVLWSSLSTGKYFIEYIVLYCAASIASLIPVTVGGLGIKESTYYYGAVLIKNYTAASVDGELGVAISLCIFALSLIAALPGVLWLHKIGHTEITLLKHPPQHNDKVA